MTYSLIAPAYLDQHIIYATNLHGLFISDEARLRDGAVHGCTRPGYRAMGEGDDRGD